MPRFFHRILFAALTSILLLPLAGQAQQQDQDKDQGQNPQAGSQTEGHQRRTATIQRQRQRMALLAQKLNLTDAQKEQFQQISRDMWKQGMAIRQDSSLTDDQKKEKMLAVSKQSHQQMFGVLTPEQKDQLKQMREQHKKEQEKDKSPGDQASAKKKGNYIHDSRESEFEMTIQQRAIEGLYQRAMNLRDSLPPSGGYPANELREESYTNTYLRCFADENVDGFKVATRIYRSALRRNAKENRS